MMRRRLAADFLEWANRKIGRLCRQGRALSKALAGCPNNPQMRRRGAGALAKCRRHLHKLRLVRDALAAWLLEFAPGGEAPCPAS